MSDFNIWNLKANFWGDEETIKRIDFQKEKVELEYSGWQDFSSVEFSYDEPYDYTKDDAITLEVNRKLKEEKAYLETKLQEVRRKELKLDAIEKAHSTREKIIKDLANREKAEFDKYVSDTVRNLNRIIHDVYQQSLVKKKNEEMKQPTPEYIKYEESAFSREMMKAIEEGK